MSQATHYRTHLAGSLRLADAQSEVRLVGWVHRRRDLGGLIFVDLRDRSGRVQLSFGPNAKPGVLETARRLGQEWVINVAGVVSQRPAANINAELATGEIEIRVHELVVLNESETPVIPVAVAPGDELPAEELRLRYRYLDLRREDFQRALSLRHSAMQVVRRHLSASGFLEIDTPMLTRRTPEGARDFLVPSRLHPGEFYALPQSPQIYKQLLMVAGYDRYFQIARCLRDEDLRADRQLEFTQIDAEMAFVTESDVFSVAESMIATVWRELLGIELATPFPRLTYIEAMERYGTDKPDLRFGLEFQDHTEMLGHTEFRVFQEARVSGARIRGVVAPGGAALSRKELDGLADVAKAAGAAGALWVRRTEEGLNGSFARSLTPEQTAAFTKAAALDQGDLFVAVVGHFRWATGRPETRSAYVDGALDALRRHLADRLNLRGRSGHAWAWVTDFPMFDWDADSGRVVAAHHPFTMPHLEDVDALVRITGTAPADSATQKRLYEAGLRSRAYDAVYNGNELASGSIRIHDQSLQRHVFRALGMTDEEAESKFGFLLEAFRYGAPPHGGFAFGFDRLVMLMAGLSSLRDVIAFPKTTAARALFEGAPAPVQDDELRELHVAVTKRVERSERIGQ
ncbi:MAG: aspartate--tRNA ligase [Longimicrobiales bacterium]